LSHPANDETAKTATINRVPDPAAADLDVLFETEWPAPEIAAP